MALVALAGMAPTAQAGGPAGRYDRAFLIDMVGHHEMAIDMATMAGEKARTPRLRELATGIVQSQRAEQRRMRSWLRKWYGARVRPRLQHHEQRQMEELERTQGAEFEIRFMALMSVHHTQAVERATVARRQGRHPAVRRLARAIVRAQEREIEEFRNLLAAYGAGR